MTEVSALSVRLPSELKAWLEARAKANHRAMNGEVISLLEAAKSRLASNQIEGAE